ncbi:MAG: hypothetical protein AAGC55_33050, partial [Myxococcota bacterium]
RIKLVKAGGASERAIREACDPGFYSTKTTPAQAVMTHRAGILVLSGTTGIGKTLCATRWLLEYGGPRPRLLGAEWMESAGRYGSRAEEVRTKWGTATGFVLDDLGVEPEPDLQWLIQLVSVWAHFTDSAAMVVTTNLTRPQFSERYTADRLLSRLQLTTWIHCPERDMRCPGL